MLANFTKLVLSSNHLLDGDYVEVYAGGASVAWSLLFEEYVQRVHLNDVSRSIYAFWMSVLVHTDDLCRLIRDTPVTMEEWYRQRNVQAAPYDRSLLELGFSTFFLNRTNRSGIMTGGVIGGKDQSGTWKMDARYNKQDLEARIQRIAQYAARISICCFDAAEFIRGRLSELSERSLVYLDPPYYAKGEGLYENHYVHDDHVRIAGFVAHIKQPWIVSYDNTPQIVRLYAGFHRIEYDLSYSAQARYAGSEIMFFSKGLTVPEVGSPAHVSLRDTRMSALV